MQRELTQIFDIQLESEEQRLHSKTYKNLEQLQVELSTFEIKDLQNSYKRMSQVLQFLFQDLMEYLTFLRNKNDIIAEILDDLFLIRTTNETEKVKTLFFCLHFIEYHHFI